MRCRRPLMNNWSIAIPAGTGALKMPLLQGDHDRASRARPLITAPPSRSAVQVTGCSAVPESTAVRTSVSGR